MVTAHRANGLHVVIFADDHEPAHVHVFGDGEAKINLIGADRAPELLWAVGIAPIFDAPCESRKSSRLSCWNDGAKFMADITDAQLDAAAERGKHVLQTQPRAASARYDRKLDRIVVDLTNGCAFTFPPRIAQGLEQANPEQLAEVEVLGVGFGLHWESLDVDLSISGLMAGIFGTRAYMARRAGQATSPAKAAAAHANGAKGGRPRKVTHA